MNYMLKAALAIRASGISIIPSTKNKQPAWWLLPYRSGEPKGKRTWRPFMEKIADEDTVRDWYSNNAGLNITLVCGHVSGNLLILDFDYDATRIFSKWKTAVNADLYSRLVVVESGKGYHIYFRVDFDELPSNKILAKRQKPNGMPNETEPLIELVSSGGLCTAPPSYHYKKRKYYRAIQNSLLDLPVLTEKEYSQIIQAAMSLNEVTAREKKATQLVLKSGFAFQTLDKKRARAYAASALESITNEVKILVKGSRNRSLNEAAFWLGRYVGIGLLDPSQVRFALEAACQANGLIQEDGMHSFDSTFTSGIQAGIDNAFTESEVADKLTVNQTHPHLDSIRPPLTQSQKEQATAIIQEIQERERWLLYHQSMQPQQRLDWQSMNMSDPVIDRYKLGFCADKHAITLPFTGSDGQVYDIEYKTAKGYTYDCPTMPRLHYVQPFWPTDNTNYLVIMDDAATAIATYLAHGATEIDGQPIAFAGLPHLRLRQETIQQIKHKKIYLFIGSDVDARERGLSAFKNSGVKVARLPFPAPLLGNDQGTFWGLLKQAHTI